MLALALAAVLLDPVWTGGAIGVGPIVASNPHDQWRADGFAHALSQRLYDLPGANVLTVRQVTAALRGFGIAPTQALDAAKVRRLEAQLGARVLIVGAFKLKGDSQELTLQVVPREGAIAKHTVSGKVGAQVALEKAAAEALVPDLGVTDAMSFVANGVTESNGAWADLFIGIGFMKDQSLSPRAADASQPSTLSSLELGKAQMALEEALQLDPALGAAAAGLAVLRALAGDFAAADVALEQAKSGKGPLPTLAATFVRLREGNVDAAIQVLRDAIAVRPGFLHARGSLGQLYNHLGRFREAKKTFEDYSALVPEQPWVLAQLGYTLARQHKMDEAIAATQKGVALAPDSPDLITELASRFIDAGRFDDAAEQLEKALKQAPHDGHIQVRLGYVHLVRGKDADAIKVTERALKDLDETRDRHEATYAHVNLTRAWAHMGQYDVALEQLALARKLGLMSSAEIDNDDKLQRFRGDARYQATLAKKL